MDLNQIIGGMMNSPVTPLAMMLLNQARTTPTPKDPMGDLFRYYGAQSNLTSQNQMREMNDWRMKKLQEEDRAMGAIRDAITSGKYSTAAQPARTSFNRPLFAQDAIPSQSIAQIMGQQPSIMFGANQTQNAPAQYDASTVTTPATPGSFNKQAFLADMLPNLMAIDPHGTISGLIGRGGINGQIVYGYDKRGNKVPMYWPGEGQDATQIGPDGPDKNEAYSKAPWEADPRYADDPYAASLRAKKARVAPGRSSGGGQTKTSAEKDARIENARRQIVMLQGGDPYGGANARSGAGGLTVDQLEADPGYSKLLALARQPKSRETSPALGYSTARRMNSRTLEGMIRKGK